MEINWFTFVAQLLNFFILVWLLKRFLYKPILDAIAERENKIISQLKEAEAKEIEATIEKDEYLKKNKMFDQEKKELMDKVIAETNDEREKRLEIARNEAIELRLKLEKSFEEMQENMEQELVQKTKQEVLSIARMTLNSLASITLDEQIVVVFIKRLAELPKDDKMSFVEAFKENRNPIKITSAFELHEKQQTLMKDAIHAILGSTTLFEFVIKPDLIGGIELTANGFKLAWSISEFINSFEKSISETRAEEYK
jgi:F-type H+-transporting ATPase subunit b